MGVGFACCFLRQNRHLRLFRRCCTAETQGANLQTLSSLLIFFLSVTPSAVESVFTRAFRMFRHHFLDRLAWRLGLFTICGHSVYSIFEQNIDTDSMHTGPQRNMCIIHQMRISATTPKTACAIQSPAVLDLPRLNTQKE